MSAISELSEFKEAAIAHAVAECPKESCGLVVVRRGHAMYVPSTNIALDPVNHFEIDPITFIKAEDLGEIIGVVHSHPFQPPEPSLADREACERSGLAWWIVNPTTQMWSFMEPTGWESPLFGRPYSHGVFDCFSFIRDYYSRIYQIEINDYPREEEWWTKGQNLYLDFYHSEGFAQISLSEAKPGDAFLLAIDSKVPNHGAIYIGGNEIAHHLYRRISSRDVLGKFYRDRIAMTLRHRSLNQ